MLVQGYSGADDTGVCSSRTPRNKEGGSLWCCSSGFPAVSGVPVEAVCQKGCPWALGGSSAGKKVGSRLVDQIFPLGCWSPVDPVNLERCPARGVLSRAKS